MKEAHKDDRGHARAAPNSRSMTQGPNIHCETPVPCCCYLSSICVVLSASHSPLTSNLKANICRRKGYRFGIAQLDDFSTAFARTARNSALHGIGGTATVTRPTDGASSHTCPSDSAESVSAKTLALCGKSRLAKIDRARKERPNQREDCASPFVRKPTTHSTPPPLKHDAAPSSRASFLSLP